MKTDERIADRCVADVLEVYKAHGYWSWMCSHGVESWELCDSSEYDESLSHRAALSQALLHLKYRHPDLWDKAALRARIRQYDKMSVSEEIRARQRARAYRTQEADSHKTW